MFLISTVVSTYFLFYEEGVDVISWVAGVQIQLVPLYLRPDGCLQRFGVAEDVIVRPRQMFHQCWESIVELFGEKIRDLFSGAILNPLTSKKISKWLSTFSVEISFKFMLYE